MLNIHMNSCEQIDDAIVVRNEKWNKLMFFIAFLIARKEIFVAVSRIYNKYKRLRNDHYFQKDYIYFEIVQNLTKKIWSI